MEKFLRSRKQHECTNIIAATDNRGIRQLKGQAYFQKYYLFFLQIEFSSLNEFNEFT